MKTDSGIAVLGAGAWGTALAQLYADTGRVTLWCRRAAQAKIISAARENVDYLPGIKLRDNIRATADAAALHDAEVILVAVPTQHLPAQLLELKNHLPIAAPIVICAKGIIYTPHASPVPQGEREHSVSHEQNNSPPLAGGVRGGGNIFLLPEVIQTVLPHHTIAILSGPNLAHEVARGLPAAALIAADNENLANELAVRLRTPSFRPYASTDVTGAALAGALKNVIALASGMVMGAGLGENARAALITRGMAEITRLGMKMGAKAETFVGLSGLGDMMLTCHAPSSRNFSCGVALGQGKSLAEVLSTRKSVTEGISTVGPALKLAAQYDVELPICAAVAGVINSDINVGAALAQLMARPLKNES